jgi:cholesterol transport system auxiliary component
MKISIKIVISFLILGALAAGCVKFDRPALDRKYFVMSVERNKDSHTNGTETLVVRRFQISPQYQDRELVYRKDKSIYEADYYNLFFVPPTEMLTNDLRRWFSDSGLFKNVVSPSSLSSGGLVLEGLVNSLYGDYHGNVPAAVVEIQFFLVDNWDENTPIIYSRTFSEKIKLKSKDSAELVEGMSLGIKNIFSKLEADLAGLKAVSEEKIN